MPKRIRAQVPAHLDDAHVLQATVAARQAGIERPDQLADVRLSGERLFVVGTIPGFRAMVQLDQPAPELQESLQQNADLNRQLAQQQEQDAQQREQQQGRGPVMG